MSLNTNVITYTNKAQLYANSSIADANKVKADDMNQIKSAVNTNLVELIYPVGAIFLSTSSTNPSTYLGGTWEQIKDVFLLGAGDTYSASSTGGEATHTLTTNEMPSHNHSTVYLCSFSGGSVNTRTGYGYEEVALNKSSYGNTVSNTGGGQAHNNMPPYLTVYIWKRTA